MAIRMKLVGAILFVSTGMAPAAYGHGDGETSKRDFNAAAVEQKKFGRAGNPEQATRVIRITMDDAMRFSPAAIVVKQGETVKFVVANRGGLMHEMVIGTPQELRSHAALMKKFPDMEHDEAHMVHVGPGKSAPLVWTFNRPGEFDFACLVAGHFEAGMTGKIKVIGKSGG
jgi:uncharacterized cupredoxin-like copper-binding protein